MTQDDHSGHDHDHDHSRVEHMDAAPTLPEREPVRTYGTAPAAILATAGGVAALGVGSPRTALAIAAGLTVVGALLELVRARVTPASINPAVVPVVDQA